MSLNPVADPLLTVVPGFVRYPPELAYPPIAHTTEPSLVLRDTNSNTHHGWLQSVVRQGPQQVRMNLPSSVRVKIVDLLRAEMSIPFELHGRELRFTIPSLDDYEVAAITLA